MRILYPSKNHNNHVAECQGISGVLLFPDLHLVGQDDISNCYTSALRTVRPIFKLVMIACCVLLTQGSGIVFKEEKFFLAKHSIALDFGKLLYVDPFCLSHFSVGENKHCSVSPVFDLRYSDCNSLFIHSFLFSLLFSFSFFSFLFSSHLFAFVLFSLSFLSFFKCVCVCMI